MAAMRARSSPSPHPPNKSPQTYSASISLDGLLDYDEDDRDEATMELSLVAEALAEALAQAAGETVLASLYANR